MSKNNTQEINYTPEQRKLIAKAIKGSNRLKGSKYLKPSFSLVGISYNDSRKMYIDDYEDVINHDTEIVNQ